MAKLVKKSGNLRAQLDKWVENASNAKSVKAGFLDDASYPDNGTPVAMIAVIQDFGAPSRGIPPRPFFRTAIKEGEAKWPKLMRVMQINGYNARQTLEYIGSNIVADIKLQITNGAWAPLAPSTIKRKGFETPLIDTGVMRDSANYEVE